MSWSHFVVQAVVAFDVFVLFYFLALNTSYLVLFLVSLREVLRFVRRTFFSDYRQIMQSGMTWPISIVVAAHNEEKTIIAPAKYASGRTSFFSLPFYPIPRGDGRDDKQTNII